MYIVIDKKSKDIIHVNPAPISQQLSVKEVYFKFDEKNMQIGKIDGEMPEYFKIDKDNNVVELDLEEKVKAGHVKTQVTDTGADDKQPVFDEANGSVVLAPHQKIVGDQVVDKSNQEMIDDGSMTLDEIKANKIEEFSSQALSLRNNILPDYKIQNALMGLCDDQKTQSYKDTVEGFRAEFHRLKNDIEKARDLKAVEAIKADFPSKIINGGKDTSAKKKTVKSKKKT